MQIALLEKFTYYYNNFRRIADKHPLKKSGFTVEELRLASN